MRKKVLDRKMRAMYECECTKGLANPGSMIAKRGSKQDAGRNGPECRVFLDHSLAQSGTYHGKLPYKASRADDPVFRLAGKAMN